MAENFQDNVVYGNSTLAVSGDAVAIGSTDAGAKSVIFNNSGSQGHLAWQPTANRTINLPDSGGTIQLTGQVPGAIIAGTQTATSGTIVFSNSNGLTFGMSNNSVITGSYTVPNQSNQTEGMYALGNTTGQSSSSTFDARTLSVLGMGNISVGYSNNALIISGAGGGGGSVNISAGTTSSNLTNFVFSNSNNISFGLNGSTITGSIPNQTIGFFATSNTTQNSSTTLDARSITFQGAGIASVGYSNGSVVISVPSGGGAGDGVNIIAAGTQTANTTGTILFSNSNGISFGMSNSSIVTASFNGTLNSVVFSNANNITFGSAGNTTITASYSQSNQNISFFALGNTTQNSSTVLGANVVSFNGIGAASVGYSNGTIQVSVPTQSAQTQSNVQAIFDGVNSISTGTIRFTNANGVSFSINGQTISGSVAAQSNQTEGGYAIGNTTGQSSSSTFDARSMSFSGAGNISLGYSNNALVISGAGGGGGAGGVALSAGTNSTNTGTVIFSNSNNMTFGMDTNGVVTGSFAGNNTASTFVLGISTQGNTSGTTGFANQSVQLVGSNGITLIQSINGNSATITISGGGAGGGGTLGFYATGNTTQNSSSSFNAGTISYNALGGMTMGFSNGSVQMSAPTVSSLSATGGVSISTNGSTINIGAPLAGTMAAYEINQYMGTASATFSINSSATSGFAYFYPFFLPGYVACGHINMIQSMSFISSSASGQQTFSQSWALYTRGIGTNSTTLGAITSNSFTIGVSASSVSHTINQPTTSNATGYGTGTFSSNATGGISSNYSGLKLVQLQINSTLSPGNYWLGYYVNKSTVNASIGFSMSMLGVQRLSNLVQLAPIGSAISAFTAGAASGNNGALGAWFEGLGSYSSAGQTNLPNSIALSAISTASNSSPFFPYLRMVGSI